MIHPLFDSELARFAFVMGIVISITVYDRLHLTTGSLIVPGYIAINIAQPFAIGSTLVNALIAYWIVYKVLPRYVVMEGATKFHVLIPLSIGLQILAIQVRGLPGIFIDSDPLLTSIGYVIPGLIAHDIGAQGARGTLVSAALVGAVVALVCLGAPAILPASMATWMGGAGVAFAFDFRWLHYAILLSVVSSVALKRNYGFKAGGFVGAAYLGMLMTQPAEILHFGILSLVTFALVNYGLKPRLILFGRRKFAAMLLVAAIVSWAALLVRQALFGAAATPLGSSSLALVGITLTGLFANDIERVGLVNVVKGTLVSVVFTLSATLLIAGFVEGESLEVLGLLAALVAVSAFITFHPQLRTVTAWGAALARRGAARRVPRPTAARLGTVAVTARPSRPSRLGRSVWGLCFVVFVGFVACRLDVGSFLREASLVASARPESASPVERVARRAGDDAPGGRARLAAWSPRRSPVPFETPPPKLDLFVVALIEGGPQ